MYNQLDFKSNNELIKQYSPLVKRIAQHLMARLPSNVVLDDLIQAGMMGLLEAAKKFDPMQGASFETYAGIRIRGSIIDEVRRGDWTPRSVHKNARRVSAAIHMIENRNGREATDSEVADELEISLSEYHALMQDTLDAKLFSIDDLIREDDETVGMQIQGNDPNPEDVFQSSAFRQALVEQLEALPERERLVMALYYDEELNLKEIGEVLGVSESRVSQIHSQAAMRLRSRLSNWH